MKTTKYHKLVRDRIPEIITGQGKDVTTRVATEDEFLRILFAKLYEEAKELEEDRSIEELADVLEVVRALSFALGSSPAELESFRARKAAKRGGFRRRLVLHEVREP